MKVTEAKKLIVQAGIMLVESGLIARTWGNVSCRINESSFLITPSGRDYMSLTPEEIVAVDIGNLRYSGKIKPSSEKAIHAEVYDLHPEINFVIHTHQENASIIGTSCLDSIKVGSEFPMLGGEVICAKYALHGTKKLRKNVHEALLKSKGNAVIMKNHGALCFGKTYDEAFMVAGYLEKACYIENPDKVNLPAVQNIKDSITEPYLNSYRSENGFILYDEKENEICIQKDLTYDFLPEEAKIYNLIYDRYKDINYIMYNGVKEVKYVSKALLKFKPILDDFAQIIGVSVKNVDKDPEKITSALKKSTAALIKGSGALCCGQTLGDAEASSIILEKACKAYISASLFGRVKPINPLECILMRFIYLKKYSKQIQNKEIV